MKIRIRRNEVNSVRGLVHTEGQLVGFYEVFREIYSGYFYDDCYDVAGNLLRSFSFIKVQVVNEKGKKVRLVFDEEEDVL